MTGTTNASHSRRPLRLWPGIAIVIVAWLIAYVLPLMAPDELFGVEVGIIAVFAGIGGGLAVIVWWLFFSRAYWSERLGAIALMIAAVLATRLIVHESIAGAGMGMLYYFSTIPGLSLALVAWAVATRRLPDGPRRALLVGAVLLACAPWAMMRTAGITSEGSEFHWRWTPTPEERLLAQVSDEPKPLAPSPASLVDSRDLAASPADKASPAEIKNESVPKVDEAVDTSRKGSAASPAASTAVTTDPVTSPEARSAAWPGFRGPNRDGVIRGLQIKTDWSSSPPTAIWRRPIGPGWSSFAVHGDLLFTQEQRGDDEIVASYRVSTGEPVWRHRDQVRFWESNGGAGPRGTPTVSNGRVFALGATGILNALDAVTGAVLWSRNVATDTGVEVPGWGFASSPLVLDDVVIVAVSGQLVGYDVRNGDPHWFGPKGGAGYSSPHPVTIDGVPQVLLLRGSRTVSVAPADGSLLWEHTWQVGVGIVQPAQVPNGDVLISVGDAMGGLGIRLLSIAKRPDGWSVEDRWTSRGLKPYFNDFVVHQGHAFGFDGSILACISLEDGSRKWKGGRYGNGQLVLLSEQNALLVLSEEGELALVGATPDQFTELARIPAIEGKTWNHPVVVGDVLLARNGQEMAAFRLPRVGR